jgi:hypothetical protein
MWSGISGALPERHLPLFFKKSPVLLKAVTQDGYLWCFVARHKVNTMIWKFLSLQKMLDALFDDSWFSLGLPEGHEGSFTPAAQTQTP